MIDDDGNNVIVKVPVYNETNPPDLLVGFGTTRSGIQAWSKNGELKEFWRTGVSEENYEPYVRTTAQEIRDHQFDQNDKPDTVAYPVIF